MNKVRGAHKSPEKSHNSGEYTWTANEDLDYESNSEAWSGSETSYREEPNSPLSDDEGSADFSGTCSSMSEICTDKPLSKGCLANLDVVSLWPKLSFDRFSFSLGCANQVSQNRDLWIGLSPKERAKRTLIHVLRCEPPLVLWNLWFKTTTEIVRRKGLLRNPWRYLKPLLRRVGSLSESEKKYNSSSLHRPGTWRI